MNSILMAVFLSCFPGIQCLVSARTFEIRDQNGAPCIFQDGQAVVPLFFWESFPQEWETREFSRRGMELFSAFRTSQHYEHEWWKEDGSIDFTFFEDGIRTLLHENPDALFLPRVFYTAPEWWVKKNPDELTVYTSGNTTTPRESFASLKFRQEAGEAYRKIIRHILDSDYAPHILGIHVASGPWGEHFYWDAYFLGNPEPQGSDASAPMQRAFERYVREKYRNDLQALRRAWQDPEITFETVRVPDIPERKALNGAWRDPKKGRKVTDYWECHNREVTDTIAYFCRIVKEESYRKLLTMVFYGYTQDENWPLEKDHRAPARLLACPDVDMYSAPHTYYRRAPGEDGEMRQYAASTALHGRLFIDEGDDQTFLENCKPHPDHRAQAPTLALSQSILQREFGMSATHATGLWYMDLQGGWFRDEELLNTVGQMRKWAFETLNHPRNSVAEVAIFSKPESEFYLGYRQTPANEIGYGLYHDQMGEFFRTGAPFDWYLLDDLSELEKRGRDYKVYVFLDCFFMTSEELAQVEKLRADGHTILWFYAPAYVSPQNLSLERMQRLTGFELEPQPEGILGGTLADGRKFGIKKTQKSLFTVKTENKTGDNTENKAKNSEEDDEEDEEKTESPKNIMISKQNSASTSSSVSVEILGYGLGTLQNHGVYASRRFENWRSIYCSVTGLPSEELRRIFREAGVHIYCDSGDVVTANASWLMIHTRDAGRRKITLPAPADVQEIVTEKSLGENVTEFEIDVPDRSTRIFLLSR